MIAPLRDHAAWTRFRARTRAVAPASAPGRHGPAARGQQGGQVSRSARAGAVQSFNRFYVPKRRSVDGRATAEGAVRPAPIAVVQPVLQGLAALRFHLLGQRFRVLCGLLPRLDLGRIGHRAQLVALRLGLGRVGRAGLGRCGVVKPPRTGAPRQPSPRLALPAVFSASGSPPRPRRGWTGRRTRCRPPSTRPSAAAGAGQPARSPRPRLRYGAALIDRLLLSCVRTGFGSGVLCGGAGLLGAAGCGAAGSHGGDGQPAHPMAGHVHGSNSVSESRRFQRTARDALPAWARLSCAARPPA